MFISSLQERFAQAPQNVNGLAERPDNLPCSGRTLFITTGEPQGRFDLMRCAKFDAWSRIKGTSAKDAMQQYIGLIASLPR